MNPHVKRVGSVLSHRAAVALTSAQAEPNGLSLPRRVAWPIDRLKEPDIAVKPLPPHNFSLERTRNSGLDRSHEPKESEQPAAAGRSARRWAARRLSVLNFSVGTMHRRSRSA